MLQVLTVFAKRNPHLPPLRFRYVGGCWGLNLPQDCYNICVLIQSFGCSNLNYGKKKVKNLIHKQLDLLTRKKQTHKDILSFLCKQIFFRFFLLIFCFYLIGCSTFCPKFCLLHLDLPMIYLPIFLSIGRGFRLNFLLHLWCAWDKNKERRPHGARI